MRVQKVLSKEFQFYIADLDNIVLVKSLADGTVTVRATKANCSDARKTAFIRHLASEGFIPDEYQWLSGSLDETKGIRWIKDYSWLKMSPVVKRRANRLMAKWLVAAGIIWLAMIRVLLVSHPGDSAGKAGQISPPAIAGNLPTK